MHTVIHTGGVAPAERFEYWRNLVSRTPLPLEMRSTDFGAFHFIRAFRTAYDMTPQAYCPVTRGPDTYGQWPGASAQCRGDTRGPTLSCGGRCRPPRPGP